MLPVVDGIPILLADEAARAEVLAANCTARRRRLDFSCEPRSTYWHNGAKALFRGDYRAYRERSHDYYADNYTHGGNPEREARQRLVRSLLEQRIGRGALVLEAGSGPAVLGSEIQRLTSAYVASTSRSTTPWRAEPE